jgi:hypothetical protein
VGPAPHAGPGSLQEADPAVRPPPNLWIEVAYNDKDRAVAMDKIERDVLPHQGPQCAVLLLVLQRTRSVTMLGRCGPAPACAAVGTEAPDAAPAEAAVVPAGALKPRLAPFLGYWPAGAAFGGVQWYKVAAGRYLDVTMPLPPPHAPRTWRFQFDDVLRVIHSVRALRALWQRPTHRCAGPVTLIDGATEAAP